MPLEPHSIIKTRTNGTKKKTWHHWTIHSQTFHVYPNKIPTIHWFHALILYYKSKELCHSQWISPSSIEAQIWPQLTHFMTGFFVLKWRSTSYVFVELQIKMVSPSKLKMNPKQSFRVVSSSCCSASLPAILAKQRHWNRPCMRSGEKSLP